MRLGPLVAAVAQAMRGFSCPARGEALVVGLSGGADSTALLDALAWLAPREGFRLLAAHFDHGLRPDSAADVEACQEVCRGLGVTLQVGRTDVRARASRDRAGLEDAARRERYAFLRAVLREEGTGAIAVAHTRDDQAETVLLRLIRGAGATGLGAMRPRTGEILRPLLRVSRAAVLAHLAERGLSWREDPTNHDPVFLRNRVRHELLPFLARFNPSIAGTLARSAFVLADEADLAAAAGSELLGRVGRPEGTGFVLDRAGLAAAHPAAARAALRHALDHLGGLADVSAAHVERLLDFARAPRSSGRRLPLPGAREAVVQFGHIRLGPKVEPAVPFAQTVGVPGDVRIPGGPTVRIRAAFGPARSGAEEAVAAVPGGAEPLCVRTRRPGDRVFVRGRAVSLKRFLVDRRIPADVRPGLTLVASGPDVLFVPGVPVGSPPGHRFVSLEVVE
jgi:tRNA(Ile)-lysidine synthase